MDGCNAIECLTAEERGWSRINKVDRPHEICKIPSIPTKGRETLEGLAHYLSAPIERPSLEVAPKALEFEPQLLKFGEVVSGLVGHWGQRGKGFGSGGAFVERVWVVWRGR